MDGGLISIVVPVYNVEKYIRKCVDSILAQTYSNIEIILIDDGSEDLSGNICDEYGRKDFRCKVIHKKNAGLGMARNSGLEIATGDYVTFVDSDDWLEECSIEELYKGLKYNKVDFCKSGFKRVSDAGTVLRVAKYDLEIFPDDDARLRLLPRIIGSAPEQKDSVEMCVWGSLYKMEIIKKFNLWFQSERVFICEDLVFNIDYMQHTKGACLIPFVGYMYRFNPKSLSTSYRYDRMDAAVFFYHEMKKKLTGYAYGSDVILRLQKLLFVHTKMCIAQETKNISHLSYKNNIENLENICKNPVLQEVIRGYPVNKLKFTQRLFLELIRHHKVKTLKLLAEKKIV